MTIDWINFTPWQSLIGGCIIGLAVTILLYIDGRIAGISGIVAGILSPHKNDWLWRALFVAGLIGSPMLYQLFAPLPVITLTSNWWLILLAGLLVGFGTRLGSGCTSGHGICGLARLSLRSIVATLLFMGMGVLTVYFMRHVWGV